MNRKPQILPHLSNLLKPQFTQRIYDQYLWLVVAAVAFFSGLVHVFLVPPWQHYDEPGHFEYVWLLANRPGLPGPGDVDANMRRRVAFSMLAYNFYSENLPPPDFNSTEPVPIGISQLDDPPGYYLLASLPLRLLKSWSITRQMYVARIVSLGLLVLTVLLAFWTCVEIFPPRHPLIWMVPMFLALLPPFVSHMTAVNNDCGATLCGTFFLWAAVRLVKPGPTWKEYLLVILALALAPAAKVTSAIIALPLGFPLLIWSFFRPKMRLLWSLIPVGVLLLVPVSLSFDRRFSAYTYAPADSLLPLQEASSQAPSGKYVYARPTQPFNSDNFQLFIPPEDVVAMRGQEVTLGVWVWSSKKVTIIQPGLVYIRERFQNLDKVFEVDTTPKFYTFHTTIKPDASVAWIVVFGTEIPDVTIYYDDWVLAKGSFPDTPPIYNGNKGKSGTWGGHTFQNVIRNGSGEEGWPFLRPAVSSFIFKHFALSSAYLWSWTDVPGMGWYYRETADRLFQTFWGVFAWGNVPLVGNQHFVVFYLISLLAVLGLSVGLIRRRAALKRIRWEWVFLCIITIVFSVAAAWMRGLGSWLERLFLPGARYIYPVILSIALFLCLGWHEMINWLPARVRTAKWSWSLVVLLMAAYWIWAVVSLFLFFYG